MCDAAEELRFSIARGPNVPTAGAVTTPLTLVNPKPRQISSTVVQSSGVVTMRRAIDRGSYRNRDWREGRRRVCLR